jgi:hypothetical protein
MIGMPLERAAFSLLDQGLSNERWGSSRPTDCRSTLRSARPTFWFAQSRWLRRPSSRPATRSHGYCRARPGSGADSHFGVRTGTRSRRTIPRNRRAVPQRHPTRTARLAIATANESGDYLHEVPRDSRFRETPHATRRPAFTDISHYARSAESPCEERQGAARSPLVSRLGLRSIYGPRPTYLGFDTLVGSRPSAALIACPSARGVLVNPNPS